MYWSTDSGDVGGEGSVLAGRKSETEVSTSVGGCPYGRRRGTRGPVGRYT